jgi:hypothetical protein
MSDSGLADVVLGGEGVTVSHSIYRFLLRGYVLTSFLQATVHVVSADKDKTSVFKVKRANCHRSREEADQESHQGLDHYGFRVRRWTARWC